MKIETAIDYLDHMSKMTRIQNQMTKNFESNPMVESIECLVAYTKKYRMIELKKDIK